MDVPGEAVDVAGEVVAVPGEVVVIPGEGEAVEGVAVTVDVPAPGSSFLAQAPRLRVKAAIKSIANILFISSEISSFILVCIETNLFILLVN
ncbi:hypothetical protein CLHUN_38710 [Ruminiclostridium hungatei]|uniref:Uncharacterized protein n=1 Tax=Ruminiclostridium hungatei TaxID=48256 RepID=A0A1V4SG36_RUMHU|nr:hypothetical protein CLHUN_38710 [Ruminiclostridium hungatei]